MSKNKVKYRYIYIIISIFNLIICCTILAYINDGHKANNSDKPINIANEHYTYDFQLELDNINDRDEYINKVKSYYTPEFIVSDLYKIIEITHKLFEANSIRYWIDGGTSIGALRHKDLIPWDDDLDICILAEDEIKLQNLKSEFDKYGYNLDYNNFAYKISLKTNKFNEKLKSSYPYLDISVMRKDRGNYVYLNWNLQKNFPKNYYPETKLFPLKAYQFGKFKLWGPNDLYWYVTHYYGDDVLVTGYIYPNHGEYFNIYFGIKQGEKPIKVKLFGK